MFRIISASTAVEQTDMITLLKHDGYALVYEVPQETLKTLDALLANFNDLNVDGSLAWRTVHAVEKSIVQQHIMETLPGTYQDNPDLGDILAYLSKYDIKLALTFSNLHYRPMDDYKGRYTTLDAEHDKLVKKCNEIAADRDDFFKRLEDTREAYDKLRVGHDEINAEYHKLDSDYTCLKVDHDALKAKAQANNVENGIVIGNLTNQVDDLKAQLAAAESRAQAAFTQQQAKPRALMDSEETRQAKQSNY